MTKKYVLTIEIELQDARDDVEARQTAIDVGRACLIFGSHPDSRIRVKLQERFEHKAPRSVIFNPYRS